MVVFTNTITIGTERIGIYDGLPYMSGSPYMSGNVTNPARETGASCQQDRKHNNNNNNNNFINVSSMSSRG